MENETTINERLGQIIKYHGLNKNTFAKKLGFNNNSGIGKIINGKTQPSYRNLVKIIEAFPEVNVEWLMLGKGDPLGRKTGFEEKYEELKGQYDRLLNEHSRVMQENEIYKTLLVEGRPELRQRIENLTNQLKVKKGPL